MAEWNDRVQEAVSRTEDEIKRLIQYLNDDVVPDVRRQSSAALHIAADRLRSLAEKMDDR